MDKNPGQNYPIGYMYKQRVSTGLGAREVRKYRLTVYYIHCFMLHVEQIGTEQRARGFYWIAYSYRFVQRIQLVFVNIRFLV